VCDRDSERDSKRGKGETVREKETERREGEEREQEKMRETHLIQDLFLFF